MASADFWRFTLNNYTCVEPREWKKDELDFRINIVTNTQNITADRIGISGVPRGARSDKKVMWKDVVPNEKDENMAAVFTGWNIGDDDAQDVGFQVAQLALKIVRGNFVVSVAATAISLIIKQFQGAYHCEGPVILAAPIYSKQEWSSMAYNQPRCQTYSYQFPTGPGCIDSQPLNLASKNSVYTAEHCIERFSGSSTTSGEVSYNHNGAGSNRQIWSLHTLGVLVLGTIVLSTLL